MPHCMKGKAANPRALPRFGIQPKLAVNQPGDRLEQEADRIAAGALSMPAATALPVRPSADPSPAPAPRQAASALASAAPPVVEQGIASAGRPLDAGTRAFFEPRLGFDFSRVRVHTDREASDSAQSMGALAYTHGRQIVFGAGRFEPHSSEGRRLLAHELTHVVQQGQAAPISAAPVATSQVAPMVQRDGPRAEQGPLMPFAHPEQMATRQEVIDALTTFLYKVQKEQGGQSLRVDDAVRFAVQRLFPNDITDTANTFLNGLTPGPVPEFAAAVASKLPYAIPRARIAHLATQKPKFSEDTRPKSLGDAVGKLVTDSTVKPILKAATKSGPLSFLKDKQKDIVDAARGGIPDALAALSDLPMKNAPWSDATKSAIHSTWEGIEKWEGRPAIPQSPPSADGSTHQPPADVNFYQSPGTTIIKTPTIKWDIPTKDPHKPQLPEPARASESAPVKAILQGLDAGAFLPAAIRDSSSSAKQSKDPKKIAEADETASSFITDASFFASQIADLLDSANKKKNYSVDLDIPMGYRRQPDLAEIFDRMEALVRKIAAAIPDGVPNIGQVIISPARRDNQDTYPARRIVRLQGS